MFVNGRVYCAFNQQPGNAKHLHTERTDPTTTEERTDLKPSNRRIRLMAVIVASFAICLNAVSYFRRFRAAVPIRSIRHDTTERIRHPKSEYISKIIQINDFVASNTRWTGLADFISSLPETHNYNFLSSETHSVHSQGEFVYTVQCTHQR